MAADLKQQCRSVSNGIKAWASVAKQPIGCDLQALRQSLPEALQDLSEAERLAMFGELQGALITWGTDIDPVVRDLRSVLREFLAVR